MNLSRASVLALQRHFVGALSTPSRTWLEPLPAPRLAFVGNVVRRGSDGCLLDLGTIGSPGEERHRIRISHRGAERLEVRVAGVPSWLLARWENAEGDTIALDHGKPAGTLELTATSNGDGELHGSLQLAISDGATERIDELPVRMTARRVIPEGEFDFNGSPDPRPFEFATDDAIYALSVRRRTSVPVTVRCFDLPAWLMVEVEDRQQFGPVHGCFFERAAPVTIRVRAQFLGRHEGSFRLETNDPAMPSLELRFAARLDAPKPCVRALLPQRAQLHAGQVAIVTARVENWGRVPARVSKKTPLPHALQLADSFTVAAARQGFPGTAMLPIRVTAEHLEPGSWTLPVSLHVQDGQPAEVELPLVIDVSSQPETNPGLHAALIVVLLLALFFILVLGDL